MGTQRAVAGLARRGLATALAATVAVIAFYCFSARADQPHGFYGVGHEALHHWYKTLRHPGTGISCCNEHDCRPTQSRLVDGKVEVELDGLWVPVPADKILNVPSPDLQSHVCAPRGAGYSYPRGAIYCVVLGAGV